MKGRLDLTDITVAVRNGFLLDTTLGRWNERDTHPLTRLLDLLGSLCASDGDYARIVVVVASASSACRGR
jgi:hypothetical protein